MAPRFETAQPFVPDISAAYGRGEAMLRANPHLASAYESAARLTAQTREAAADRAFRSQEAGLDRAQQAAGQSAAAMGRFGAVNAETQQREFDRFQQNQQFYARLGAEAQQQEAQLRAQAESQKLASWLRKQEFVYADQLELQKKDRYVRALTTARDDHLITDEEYRREMKRQVTGIDELRQRQQETQMKLQQQQVQQYEQETELRSKAARMTADVMAKYTDGQNVFSPAARMAAEQEIAALPPEQQAQLGPKGSPGYEQEVRKRAVAKSPGTYIAGYDYRDGVVLPRMAELKRPESAGLEAKQAAEAGAMAVKSVHEMVAARLKSEQPLDDWMKTSDGISDKIVEMAQASARASRAYTDALSGRSQQPAVGAKAFESADPMNWTEGFDRNNPPPGKPAQLVQTIRQQEQELQNNDRFYQSQKNAVYEANRKRFAILAKAKKTPEDIAEFTQLGKVRAENQPAQAEAPAPAPAPYESFNLPLYELGSF